MKQIKIKLLPNGMIEAETNGIKGKACLNYVKVLEQLTGAKAVDSDYTAEYDEQDELIVGANETEITNG